MLFGAFGVSLYVSYLYYKEHQPQPIPAEVKDNMSQIINYSVNIIGVDGDKVTVENMENQEQLEFILTSETIYSKIAFSSEDHQTANKNDIQPGFQAQVSVLEEKDNPELKVQFIEILLPN